MPKEAVRSGVTFDKEIYKKLEAIVENSKRFKIDKSEIINAILGNADLDLKEIQKKVMDYREKK
jgi:ribosomal protein L1